MTAKHRDQGTVEGWKWHQQQRSTACAECTAAHDEYLFKIAQMRNGQPPRRVQRWERARTALNVPRPANCELSKREWDVAMLAIRGLSNGEIATELSISVDTVKSHVRTAYERTGVRNRTELAILTYRRGWLPADLVSQEDQVAVPRELFLSLARIAHLVQYGRFSDAKIAARQVTPQLPMPRTEAP